MKDIDIYEENSSTMALEPKGNEAASVSDCTADIVSSTKTPQRMLAYRDAGTQTLPPADAHAFRYLYERKPTLGEMDVIISARRSRSMPGAEDPPYNTITGTPYPMPLDGKDEKGYQDSSFQTFERLRKINDKIIMVRKRAWKLVKKLSDVAAKAGYAVDVQNYDKKLVHTIKWRFSIPLEELLTAIYTNDVRKLQLQNLVSEKLRRVSGAATEETEQGEQEDDREDAKSMSSHQGYPDPNPGSSSTASQSAQCTPYLGHRSSSSSPELWWFKERRIAQQQPLQSLQLQSQQQQQEPSETDSDSASMDISSESSAQSVAGEVASGTDSHSTAMDTGSDSSDEDDPSPSASMHQDGLQFSGETESSVLVMNAAVSAIDIDDLVCAIERLSLGDEDGELVATVQHAVKG